MDTVAPRPTHFDRRLHAVRTAVDDKLIERIGIDEFSLRRLRREFLRRCNSLTYTQRRALEEGGTYPRFRMMIEVVRAVWPEEYWQSWLRYLEHSARDVDEMCRGEYPISPYLIRLFSALFGIRVEFLLLGSPPSIDRAGANIDVWPLIGSR